MDPPEIVFDGLRRIPFLSTFGSNLGHALDPNADPNRFEAKVDEKLHFRGAFGDKTPDFLAKTGCQWSYWPDLNRRPADYELRSLYFTIFYEIRKS